MKKMAIPFVIFLALIGLALVAYGNGHTTEQPSAPEQMVMHAQDEVAHKESAGKPLNPPQKEPAAAPTATATAPAAHPMDHMTPEAVHEADGHAPAEHMAGDHGVPAEAAAVENPIPASDESIRRGAAIFSQSCAVCHGNTGKGDGPGAAGLNPKPADLHADHVQGNSDGAMFWIISHGREGTAMPPWDTILSEEQRWDAVNFLRTFREE